VIVALLAGLFLGTMAEECPATLELKGRHVRVTAQPYADCMARPHLPTAAALAERKAQCAALLPQGATADDRTIGWIDQIAANFPGCETRLRMVRR